MKRRLRRVTVIAIVAAGTAAVTLLVGLVTNVASERQQWPGLLAYVQRYPWQSLAVLAIAAVCLAFVFAALSAPTLNSGAGAAERGLGEEGPPPTLAPTLRTLPRDLADFANREQEIEWLRQQVDHAGADDTPLPVHTIGGMPGVGKTAFAVHIGHVLAQRFPDGQVFLDLNGYTPGRSPVPPGEALASLLLADGVPPQMIPGGSDPWVVTEARAALWRSRIANRCMLVILDNAASFQQVEHLLPPAGGSLVVVTSRRRLVAPEAVTVQMNELDADAAAGLLIRLSRRSGLATESVSHLVDVCGCLPLAISLLAAQLRQHPSWSVEDLQRRIVGAGDRLSEMRAGDRAVAAAFDLSYQDLPSERQLFFLRLSSCPGQDFDQYSAAALGDTSPEDARGHLEALYENHLLDETDQGRYRLHDLLRDYARSMGHAELPEDQAVERLAVYYLRVLRRVNESLGPGQPDTESTHTSPAAQLPAGLGSPQSALAWIVTEHANVLACLSECHSRGHYRLSLRLAEAMFPYLRHAGPWDRAINVQQTAIAAAQRINDSAAEANALRHLGMTYRLMANYSAALGALSLALETYRERDDRTGQGRTLNQLGIVWYLAASYPQAETAQRQALDYCREAGDVLGQANALADLGMVLRITGPLAESAAVQTEALQLHRQINDRFGEANALRALGVVSCLTGAHQTAIRQTTAAFAIYEEIDDRVHQAYALNELGTVKRRSGDAAAAAQSHKRALSLFRDVGDLFGEAEAMRHIAIVQRQAGDLDGAWQTQERAFEIYKQLASRGGHAAAACELGTISRIRGDFLAAEDSLSRALETYRDLGDGCGHVEVLIQLGLLWLAGHKLTAAADHLDLAVRLAQEIGLRIEEADALCGLARCDEMSGSFTSAEDRRRAALSIYEAVGITPPGPLSSRSVTGGA